MLGTEIPAIKALGYAVDDLAAEDPGWLFDDQLAGSLQAIETLRRRVDAARLRFLAEADRRTVAEAEGHRSTASWLAQATGMSWRAARLDVGLARALELMPATAAALAEGAIDVGRARMLATAHGDHPELFSRDETVLVNAARRLRPRDLRTAVECWRQAAAPEHFADHHHAMFQQRRLHLSETHGGMMCVDGVLDPESGHVVATALRALTEPAARDANHSGDDRTPPQRRADALVEICRHYLDLGATPTSGGEKPHLTVLVDLQVLEDRTQPTTTATRNPNPTATEAAARAAAGTPGICETGDGQVLTPEAARRLACDARITRVVTKGPSQILDVGRATRTIPPALRTALVVRDRGCTWEGCDQPPRHCDAHHIIPWANGGPTNLTNLQLLCRWHHRQTHEQDRALEQDQTHEQDRAPP